MENKSKEVAGFVGRLTALIVLSIILAGLWHLAICKGSLICLRHAPTLAGILFILLISFATIQSHLTKFVDFLDEQDRRLPGSIIILQCTTSLWLLYAHFIFAEEWRLLVAVGSVSVYLCIWAWYDAVMITRLKLTNSATNKVSPDAKRLLRDFIDTFRFIDAPAALSSLLAFLMVFGVFVVNWLFPRWLNISSTGVMMICFFASGCATVHLFFSSIIYLGNFSEYVFGMKRWYFKGGAILPGSWPIQYAASYASDSGKKCGKKGA